VEGRRGERKGGKVPQRGGKGKGKGEKCTPRSVWEVEEKEREKK